MFNSAAPKEREDMGVETLIGSSTHVDGHLKVKGGLRVDGRVTGQLSVEGRCEVGADGYIEATVHATELTVAGRIAGDVEVAGRLHVLSTGAISGDVRTRVLVVEEGGTIEGKCSMGQPSPEGPASRDGAAPETRNRVASAEAARS